MGTLPQGLPHLALLGKYDYLWCLLVSRGSSWGRWKA